MSTEINTYECGARKIVFEVGGHNVKGQLTHAKKYCNSAYLESGHFAERSFNDEYVREATPEEVTAYEHQKACSIHAVIL